MADSITAKEVAQQAGVSVGTVSRVFNNHSNVSDEIRQRVLKIAAELGYFRSVGQAAIGRPHSRILKEVGFLYCSSIEQTPATLNPYWTPIFQGVENESRQANIKITYRTITDICHTPHALLSALYEMRLGGVLLVGQPGPDTIEAVRSTRTPVVQIDNYIAELEHPIDSILPDNFQGASTAMEYLFHEGHQRIAFIGGPAFPGPRPIYRIHSIQQRWISYCMAFLNRGLLVPYDLVDSGDLSMEGGYAACKRLIEKKLDFSAIFCVDDITAIGAMKALREAGLSVPDDVSVIGFDGIDLGQHVTPALTTMSVDANALGSIALKTLIARASEPESPCVTTLLEAKLVKRESVAPPGHR